MEALEFKVLLRQYITTIKPCYTPTDKTQLAIRCPFCGDSRTQSSTHFYIKIDLNKDIPVLYHCFRCESSGLLTPSVLRTLDIHDLTLNSSLIQYNNEAVKVANKSLGITDNKCDFTVPEWDEDDENNNLKKKYFEERLGIETTFEELQEMKIILKLGQFLRHNKIDSITTGQEKAVALNNKYLGFLTIRNEFINFRQVVKDKKFERYENYKVINSLDNTRRFYTIPNQIDLLTTKKITINITEGPFDIQGVYHHLYEKDDYNNIFVAACGSGYSAVIKYFIGMGVFGNVDVNIYSDNDRQPYFYKKMINELSPFVDTFNLFYNDKHKDFGVPKDKISVIKKKL